MKTDFNVLNNAKKSLDYQRSYAQLLDFYQTANGQQLLKSEQAAIETALADCFGYYLLQLSVLPQANFYSASRVQCKFAMHRTESEFLLGNAEQLPFGKESIDAIVLHHSQELADSPHQILREADRVLVNGGHLVIVGFNPYSLMGLLGRGNSMLEKQFKQHWLSQSRVKDWLSLLGFKTLHIHQGCHAMPLLKACSGVGKFLYNKMPEHLLPLFQASPLGAYYCLSAVKQAALVTPIKHRWHIQQPNLGTIVNQPVKQPISSSSRDNP